MVAAALCTLFSLLYYVGPITIGGKALADDVPSAEQARPAERLAAALPLLPGTTRDYYDTSCGIPTPYCVTSSSLSARQLALGIRAMLIARGATIARRLDCDDSADPLLGGCVAMVTYRGVKVGVWARDARKLDGVTQAARGYVFINGSFDPELPGRPLGAWSTLGLFPAAWGGPACAVEEKGGCKQYVGTLTVAVPMSRAVPAARSRLVSWGLALDQAHCWIAHGRRACVFGGSKFRAPGGADRVIVVVGVQAGRRAGTSAIHVLVTH